MKRILFVCEGNVNRSPMAEGIFNVMVKNHKLAGFQAFSRGVCIQPGAVIDPYALEVLQECAAENTVSTQAAPLRTEDIESAYQVYCMTGALCQELRQKYPQYADKIHAVAAQDIINPENQMVGIYRKCRGELVDALYDIILSLQ